MKMLQHFFLGSLRKKFVIWLCWLFAAAVSQSFLLISLNLSIKEASNDKIDPRFSLMFFASLALLTLSHKLFPKSSIGLLSELIQNFRKETANNIKGLTLRDLELLDIENLEQKLIGVSERTVLNSTLASMVLLNWLVFLLILFYLLSISVAAFVIASLFLVMAFFYFTESTKESSRQTARIQGAHKRFLEALQYFIKGFKEMMLNQLKAKYFLEEYEKEATELYKATSSNILLNLYGKGNFELFYFGLIVFAVFVVPQTGEEVDTVGIVSSILFVLPLIFVSFVFVSVFKECLKDIGKLSDLYFEIKAKSPSEPKAPRDHKPKLRSELLLKNIYFDYRDAEGKTTHSLGPVNLKVKRGETLFVVGANGSGKSTILKLMTGLYKATKGEIYWDGKKVHQNRQNDYKELFSILFTDFHLFENIYGIPDINAEHVRHLLGLMELDHATSLNGKSFSNLKLSTGQKKRLALLQAFLDSKQVYILDEVAADQDPAYRRFFYNTVLPELKKAGKTAVVVSHDDNYFHTADRIVEIKQGKVSSYKHDR